MTATIAIAMGIAITIIDHGLIVEPEAGFVADAGLTIDGGYSA
ncbi:MAG: hypothetical protein ACHQIO_10755 [Nevskiales bacterium]